MGGLVFDVGEEAVGHGAAFCDVGVVGGGSEDSVEGFSAGSGHRGQLEEEMSSG